jgi:small subunit ribosomal protein S3
MSHNVHPYGHRIGVIRGWKSRWFADGITYQENLRQDILTREFLEKRLLGYYVSSIEFERSKKATRLIIRTSRPGMVIGRNGDHATKLRKEIATFMRKNKITPPKDFQVDILEVREPDADAKIVSHMIVEMLQKRMPFRRVSKQVAEQVMNVRGVKGVRIAMAGRLGGAEMARKEGIKRGAVPLQFMRADIDYAVNTARLPYGGIGIKVWINKGDSLDADREFGKGSPRGPRGRTPSRGRSGFNGRRPSSSSR